MAGVTGTTDSRVTWQVNPSVGTINASGLYTAPVTLAVKTTVTITAVSTVDPSKSSTVAATLTAGTAAPTLSRLDVSSLTLIGGQATTVSLFVNLPPSAPLTASATSSNPALATVGSPVTIAAGQISAVARIQTSGVTASTTVNITFAVGGVSKVFALTLVPPSLTQVGSYPDSPTGGLIVTSAIYLNMPAPAGLAATVTSSNPLLATVPAQVVFVTGETSARVMIQTLGVTTVSQVTVTFTVAGNSKSLTITLLPTILTQLDSYTQTATGGNDVWCKLVMSGATIAATPITAVSSNPTLASVSGPLAVPAGQSSVSVKIQTGKVAAPSQVSMTFTVGSVSLVLNISLLPPVISQLDQTSQTVVGGSVVASTVYAGTIPISPLRVTASSSNPALASVASVLTIPAGRTIMSTSRYRPRLYR